MKMGDMPTNTLTCTGKDGGTSKVGNDKEFIMGETKLSPCRPTKALKAPRG
jgi:hypothetical protein